jgi:predicted esterase
MNLQKRKLTAQEASARAELNQALAFHLGGNKAGALKALRQALALDPNLKQEKLAVNLAQELTGLPAQEAFEFLANESASSNLIKSARKEERRAVSSQPVGASVYMLGALVVVLIGMIVWGVNSGLFSNSLKRMELLQIAQQKYNSNGYEYYMLVPSGTMPVGGWHVVVAFHGMGGQGGDMLWLAENFTNAGAIFIAPTFGGYQPNPGNGPIEPLSQILKEIGEKYPVQPRGAVLLGFSQGGAFAFRFSALHPEQVRGVVTAGAPEYDQIFPPRSGMPYIFTWGEQDGLQDFVIPAHVEPLRDGGYNIATFIIPGYGHEMTPFAIEQALNMIR